MGLDQVESPLRLLPPLQQSTQLADIGIGEPIAGADLVDAAQVGDMHLTDVEQPGGLISVVGGLFSAYSVLAVPS
jgi:hypothetical protein